MVLLTGGVPGIRVGWWASGDSCGGAVTIFLNLVGGSRAPEWEGRAHCRVGVPSGREQGAPAPVFVLGPPPANIIFLLALA